MRRCRTPLAALLLLTAGACSAAPRVATDVDTTGRSAGPAVPAAATTDTADFAGSIAPVDGAGSGAAGITTLVAVRTAVAPGGSYERVVFELDGPGLPAYRVAYADQPPQQCGSGSTVPVTGDAVLTIRLRQTRAHAERGGAMAPTIVDRDRRLAQPVMRQLTLICDFEGETEWVLGLAGRRPFRVLELSSPTRLVVDVGSAPAGRAGP
jgi:hypothetical protein